MTKCTYGESARMTWPKAIRIEGNGQYARSRSALTIKPLDNLSDQLARKCDFIERPTLNACVNIHSCMVA